VITAKLFDYRQNGYDDYNKLSDKEISQMFETQNIKVFTDIIFVDNKHNIIVKVWQKVRFICKLPEVVKAIKIKNSIRKRKDLPEGLSRQSSDYKSLRSGE